jgi:immunoglobulin-binding protein 1
VVDLRQAVPLWTIELWFAYISLRHIQLIRECRGQSVKLDDVNDDLGLIASMLPPPNTSEEDQQDDDDDETLRDIYLLVIRLIWVHAQSQLESMEQELELLQKAPPLEPEHSKTTTHEDSAWRLESPSSHDGKGPLMDSSGRVSDRSARARRD